MKKPILPRLIVSILLIVLLNVFAWWRSESTKLSIAMVIPSITIIFIFIYKTSKKISYNNLVELLELKKISYKSTILKLKKVTEKMAGHPNEGINFQLVELCEIAKTNLPFLIQERLDHAQNFTNLGSIALSMNTDYQLLPWTVKEKIGKSETNDNPVFQILFSDENKEKIVTLLQKELEACVSPKQCSDITLSGVITILNKIEQQGIGLAPFKNDLINLIVNRNVALTTNPVIENQKIKTSLM